jgi:hypothetical protein
MTPIASEAVVEMAPSTAHAAAPGSPSRARSAIEMIADCFRHQHPEAFGNAPVAGPVLPADMRGGRDEALPPRLAEFIPEEPMGHPDSVRLGRQSGSADWRWDV